MSTSVTHGVIRSGRTGGTDARRAAGAEVSTPEVC